MPGAIDPDRTVDEVQTDPLEAGLAAVRDPAPLGKLPHDERAAWRALWAAVAGLQQKVEPRK